MPWNDDSDEVLDLIKTNLEFIGDMLGGEEDGNSKSVILLAAEQISGAINNLADAVRETGRQ